MAALTENAITKLSTTVAVDMKTAANTLLYTVPAGKSLIITHAIIRSNSASLASGTSYSVTNFVQTFSLTGMTTTTGYRVIHAADNTTYVISVAGTAINWTVTTGSAGAATAVIELYGVLF
jgi:hypothetical protein